MPQHFLSYMQAAQVFCPVYDSRVVDQISSTIANLVCYHHFACISQGAFNQIIYRYQLNCCHQKLHHQKLQLSLDLEHAQYHVLFHLQLFLSVNRVDLHLIHLGNHNQILVGARLNPFLIFYIPCAIIQQVTNLIRQQQLHESFFSMQQKQLNMNHLTMMYCSTGKSMVKEIQCKSLGNFYNILSSLISLFFGFYIVGPQVSCR